MKKTDKYLFTLTIILLCSSLIHSQIKVEVPQQNSSATEITIKNTNPAPKPAVSPPAPGENSPVNEVAGVKVKLYYLREATKIVALLDAVKAQANSGIKELIIKNATEDEIILYGPEDQRDRARRVIVTLDLPRPGINMNMWGIQISSRNPEQLSKAMMKIRGITNQTQLDIRETFVQMQEISRRTVIAQNKKTGEPSFRDILKTDLGFSSALDTTRPLSLTDILMLMVASDDPSQSAMAMAARLTEFGNKFQEWKADKKYKEYAELLNDKNKPPFGRFLRSRGLVFKNGNWMNEGNEVEIRALQSREALLDFALQYGTLVHEPQKFSPYYLQQAAETLNSRLQNTVDALNLDLEELFVVPTLIKIQTVVRDFKDVEYAQVGKTNVATLSGISTEVASYSVGAFDVTPPLTLSELLTKADELSKKVNPFVPTPADNLVGQMPLSQVIGLIGAFGEERSVWRELKAGVSLKITPNVLRNMTSAELQLDVKTGDPQAGTREQGVRPLSRVSQHDVKTSVYVNALDFFDISSFSNESTLNGGRGYVPVIGTVWRGLFYDVPVFGKLFSWQKNPQTVHHESLILTTSLITPTVMGIAILYPTESPNSAENNENSRSAAGSRQTGKKNKKSPRILVEEFKNQNNQKLCMLQGGRGCQ